MKKLSKELEFISQIKRDGSGLIKVKKSYLNSMLKHSENFELKPLSLTEKTYIAFNFNVFIVRLKDNN